MIAIIVAAHGELADELLKSSALISGEQENVTAVAFVPGEDQSHLLAKYTDAISHMDASEGVLFLCDLFGGSPFNAASRMAANESNWDVVTGVNLPMLLELFGLRSGSTLSQLAESAKQAGIVGVQSLKSLKPVEEEEL